MKIGITILLFLSLVQCSSTDPFPSTIYFLLTDRFENGRKDNDITKGRTNPAADLRNFMGGDLLGITQKINEGYFTSLGVDAIWLTPIVEQIDGSTDEGTGVTYGYHGYWAKDWTALDPNFGTEEELKKMIASAHSKGIRIIMDVVLNHTGPVTSIDPVWPIDWVRTEPACVYQNYETTVLCTLVKNLPDVLTESESPVELPSFLIEKWKKEGRLEKELAELDAFFERTNYPRAPKYYLIKWTIDWILKYGISGFRIDTAKHTEPELWAILRKEAEYAFEQWKKNNPDYPFKNASFFMMGEVYGYGLPSGRWYDFGNKKVDFYENGMDALINFDYKYAVGQNTSTTFETYDQILGSKDMTGKTVVHYLNSHDDGSPFDKERKMPYESANLLMLAPGSVQIYYGDETSRPLNIPANGDAKLRSFMNWTELDENPELQSVLAHWQKLGQFRKKHPAVARGKYIPISESPFVFGRTLGQEDAFIAGLKLKKGKKNIPVKGIFKDGTKIRDYYSGVESIVKAGEIRIKTPYDLVLIEQTSFP